MLNVHHLELFYYVAKSGGIVAACRQMPYGIQQPAMSAQVARLEEDLGVRLFERRPFRLTVAGQTLYDFIAPFFGRLGDVEELVRGKLAHTVRLAGLTEVMRDHVPVLLGRLREKYPDLKVTLNEIDQRGAERLIAEGGADLAITVLESKLPSGFRSTVLAQLAPGLLVLADSPYRRAADVIKAGSGGRLPLISLPAHEMLPRSFQQGLVRQKIRLADRDGDKFPGSGRDLCQSRSRRGSGREYSGDSEKSCPAFSPAERLRSADNRCFLAGPTRGGAGSFGRSLAGALSHLFAGNIKVPSGKKGPVDFSPRYKNVEMIRLSKERGAS